MNEKEKLLLVTFLLPETKEKMTKRVKATDTRQARNRICNQYGNRCDFSPFNRSI